MPDQTTTTLPDVTQVTTRDNVPLGLLAVETAYEPIYETVRSEQTPRVPDPGWTMEHGDHEHSWTVAAVDGQTRDHVLGARQEWRNVPCDGSCGGVCGGEGYEVRVWVCEHTGEDVEPGTLPDPRGSVRTFLTSETFEITVILDTAREFPRTIENARLLTRTDENAIAFLDLPDVMHLGEQTFESGGPSSATYSGGPLPREGES